MLREIAENIWVMEAPHQWLAFHVGTRMTVVKLATEALVLHSPVPMPGDLRSEIDSLGTVRHIVCSNFYHHVYAADAVKAYPTALLYGPAELRLKRKDLHFDMVLSETTPKDWNDELLPLTIKGCLLRETVFFHPATKTLISSDLVENFESSPYLLTRLYLRASGVYGRLGWSRFLRLLYRDRRAARESIDRLLEWPIERAVIAHGNLILHDARAAIAEAFQWL